MSATLTVLRRLLAETAMAVEQAEVAAHLAVNPPPTCSDPIAYAMTHCMAATHELRSAQHTLHEARTLLAQDVMEFRRA